MPEPYFREEPIAKRIVEQLRLIFDPRSVAVIGASGVPYKWGGMMIQRLSLTGFKGAIYPINPRENEIQGLPVYRTVLDVPHEIDLAVITVRAEAVPQAMRECVQKGIKGAVVISAGFAETGNHGRALQDEIREIARQGDLRFVGPNCVGIWSAASGLNFSLSSVPSKGVIGFISQSGTLGRVFAQVASNRGYGLSKFVSVGNQADLDIADYLEYMANDADTKVIVMYIEGFSDGRKLLRAARGIAGKKPVIVYKAGKNRAIARVAMSHTAAVAGEDRIFDAMCQQVGFIRASELLSSLDMAAILTRQPLPKGNRVGILGTGGQCVVLSDICVSMGMEVPELSNEEAAFIISEIEFPPHAPTPSNPVDFAGSNRTALMEAKVLNKLAQFNHIDALISNTPVTFLRADSVSTAEQEQLEAEAGELLAAIPQKYGKPMVTIGFGDLISTGGPLQQSLDSAGITSYLSPEEAVRALHTLMKYADIRKQFSQEQTARVNT